MLEVNTERFGQEERDVTLFKGSFCGLAIEKKSLTATTNIIPFRRMVSPLSQLALARWLVVTTNMHCVHLSPMIKMNAPICEMVLRSLDRWPESEIEQRRQNNDLNLNFEHNEPLNRNWMRLGWANPPCSHFWMTKVSW